MVPDLSAKEKDKLLQEARDRFAYVNEQDKENRDAQQKDTRFVYVPGAQWADDIRKSRKALSDDPCLEFNQLKQFVNQVVNDQRQSRPGIRVHPADGEASEKVAEVLQGLIRGIEYDSNAEAVYDSGYQHCVVGGRGYWRIVSEYEDPRSFNQKLVIKRIADPLSVFCDPDHQNPDGSDKNYAFIVEALTKDEFKERYPDAESTGWQATDANRYWYVGEKIIVADYYRRICTKRQLVALSDGTTLWKDELPEVLPDGLTVVDERPTDDYSIEWYVLAGGDQVLEQHEWPGSIVPVVCAMGDEIMVDGKRLYQGLIRQAHDAQSLFNFSMTAQAIHLALTPRAPYIMAAGQDEGYENIWKNANRVNYGYLLYNPKELNGNLLPPPQRQAPSMPDAGWINASDQSVRLIRSTIGMYENSLGLHGQETSGRAILAREKQGDNATFHYADNHARAIALTGRIILEAIPTYYDAQRLVHLVGEDDTRHMETVNQPQPDPMNPAESVIINDLTKGKYSVTVSAGPSYATKRQEAADLLMQMVQAVPQVLSVAGDIVVKNQDLPDADVLADRMKYIQPPALQQALAAEQAGKDPKLAQAQAQLQQVMQQAQQAVQQLQAKVQQLGQENAQLKADKSAQIQANQAKAAEGMANAQNDRGQLAIESDKNLIEMLKVILPYIHPQPAGIPGAADMGGQILDAHQ